MLLIQFSFLYSRIQILVGTIILSLCIRKKTMTYLYIIPSYHIQALNFLIAARYKSGNCLFTNWNLSQFITRFI